MSGGTGGGSPQEPRTGDNSEILREPRRVPKLIRAAEHHIHRTVKIRKPNSAKRQVVNTLKHNLVCLGEFEPSVPRHTQVRV